MSTTSTPPLHYLLPLFPGFQLLDVAGPLDILNLLSISHPHSADISLTIIASTLDPVPTKPIAPVDPATGKPKWTFTGFPTNPANNQANVQFNQHLVPNVTYSSYLSALQAGTIDPASGSKHKPVDVLLIPGGIGTRITRTDTTTSNTISNVADLLDFIPQIASRVRHSIVTVCTGSDVLAQTGLLDNRRATTNMTRFDMVAERSPGVKWLKARRWVRSLPSELTGQPQPAEGTKQLTESEKHLTDAGARAMSFHGEIWTSAGISAGIDVMLAFVAEYYGGVEVSREVASKLEYEWREIGEGAVDPMYGLAATDLYDSGVVDQS